MRTRIKEKLLVVLMFIVPGFVPEPTRADTLGSDVAANYLVAPYFQNWTNNMNGGYGFQPWEIWKIGAGGTFVYDSTQSGAGDVNTSNFAFGMWANPVGNNYSFARRFFTGGGLTVSNRFTMDLAPSAQVGYRGVSLLDAQNNTLWTFTAGSNAYAAGGVDLGWTYAQNSVFNLSAEQTSTNNLLITLVRGAQSFTSNVSGRLAGFMTFVGNSPSGGANNFYFNNLALQGAPLPPGAITIGPGQVIGTDVRGTAWREEFQEWEHRDVRALDPADDNTHLFYNGSDTGRDLVAFYSRDEEGEDRIYFRVDFLELGSGWQNGEVDVYVAIDCAPGGQVLFPNHLETRTAYPWEAVVVVSNSSVGAVIASNFSSHADAYLGSHWNSELDSVEFGMRRSFLTERGWDGSATSLFFQVFSTRPNANLANRSDIVDHVGGTLTTNTGDGNGLLQGAIRGDAITGRAKYAVIAHGNQSVNSRGGTQSHIYTNRPDMNLYPGFIRLLDSAEMLKTPINLHISGSLLISFQWAAQNPSEPSYPRRDGPTFLNRVKNFVTGDGPGSLLGGTLAEHIMPYFEGEVNAKSIRQKSELIEHLFGLTEADMKVMHVPERVIRSDTNNPWVSPDQPLTGQTFKEIEESGFVATYIDEVAHLHWWFYPNEQNGWTDSCTCTKWAGWMGCQDEAYHHKIHKINGVYTFMINDKEDFPKFWIQDNGLHEDIRRALLGKARSADQAQVSIIFDDWEAIAGNSFGSPNPNHNADQFHHTLRWLANHPWIELVNLKDVLDRIDDDPSWVIDHGHRYDLSSQNYEWLKRASEHSYDNWYYGSAQEESFFNRVPPVAWDAAAFTPAGMKMYGDMNTPGTLVRDSWDAIQQISAPSLRHLAEWSYSAMIYETAWHDEDANPDRYQSRNYQATFNRNDGCTISTEDTTWDPISGWALKLHGHIRHTAALKDVDDWLAAIRSGAQGRDAQVMARDVDDDTLDEYILRNDRVYLCFERWGARLVRAFVYDPDLDEAIMVVGTPISNPPNEHENEGADESRCSGFKDRWSTGQASYKYVDMDFGFTAPVAGFNTWTFTSKDGKITKKISLGSGRDVAVADYAVAADVGTLYTRFGLGPNQMDLIFNGTNNLRRHSDTSFRGLHNTAGGAAYVVVGPNCGITTGTIANAGWDNREMALAEQVEIYNTATNFSVAMAFSLASALDLDGDELNNTNEWLVGTDPWNPDTDADGIPDGWEVVNGLSALVQDAHLESSTPGLSNFEKYVMNADPNDPTAYLSVAQAAWSPSGMVVEHSVSAPRHYQILYIDGLESPLVWQPFGNTNSPVGSWLATDPSVIRHTFTDDFSSVTSGGLPTNGLRFYTIRVSVPE